MGIVLGFTAKSHARASSREARTVNVSEVIPANLALSVERTADHLCAGMLSRCHHLETVGAGAETSEAIASLEGHSSITSRKDRISAMPDLIGQLVLKRKANLSLDAIYRLGHTVRMADSEIEAQFKQEFTARVKAARVATGLKQWQVAEALNMPQDKYKQYEGRSLLPHHLVGRFCTITHVDPLWLMTGQGQKALRPLQVVEAERDANPKPKRIRRSKAA